MENQYTREGLLQLVEVVLNSPMREGIKIDPSTKIMQIDEVIPEVVLHDYDPKDVLWVANEAGFLITKCDTCYKNGMTSFKANGVWVRPDPKDELTYLNARMGPGHRFSDSQCPECEKDTLARIEAGDTRNAVV